MAAVWRRAAWLGRRQPAADGVDEFLAIARQLRDPAPITFVAIDAGRTFDLCAACRAPPCRARPLISSCCSTVAESSPRSRYKAIRRCSKHLSVRSSSDLLEERGGAIERSTWAPR